MLNPYAIIGAILMAIALAGGGYYQGWEKRGDHEAAIALKAERKVAADKLEAARVAAEKLAAEHERADKLAGELALEKENIKTVTIEKIKEVPVVTTVYKESPNAPVIAIPASVYTVGFVRVWNDAYRTIGIPPSPGVPADPSGDADLVRAKVGSSDILTNHIENAGKHAACYAQLNKLIDFELGRGKPAQ